MDITKVEQKTVVNQIMESLKELITQGKIKPGDKLPTETELAEKFGASRASVREAIKVFKYIGVFDSQPKTGTVLNNSSSISKEALTWTFLLADHNIREILSIRKIIEQEGWVSICTNFKKKDPDAIEAVKKLEQSIVEMENAVSNNDKVATHAADFNFHKIVIDYTKNNLLISLFETLSSFTHEEMSQCHIYLNNTNSMRKHLVKVHRKMYHSIFLNDIPFTLSLFQTHIDETLEMVLDVRHATTS